jgi:hypothetical protein
MAHSRRAKKEDIPTRITYNKKFYDVKETKKTIVVTLKK